MNSERPQMVSPLDGIEVSIAGTVLFFSCLWELVFNRLFTAVGAYKTVGTVGVWGRFAQSGTFAVNLMGVLCLVLGAIILQRIIKNPFLLPLSRILLMVASAALLSVTCIAVFSPIPALYIKMGFITANLSTLFFTLMAATYKFHPKPKGAVAVMGLLAVVHLLSTWEWYQVNRVVHGIAESAFVTTPIVAFFAFCPKPILGFVKRPHLPGLIFALVTTIVAGLVADLALSNSLLTLILVAYRTLGLTLIVPFIDSIAYLPYLISYFFGALLVGTLVLPSKRWPTTQRSKRIGFGMALVLAVGLRADQPYQFIALFLGFSYLTIGICGPDTTDEQ